MTLLNTLCERRKVTPEQLLQDDGGNQQHNLSDSTNSADSKRILQKHHPRTIKEIVMRLFQISNSGILKRTQFLL